MNSANKLCSVFRFVSTSVRACSAYITTSQVHPNDSHDAAGNTDFIITSTAKRLICLLDRNPGRFLFTAWYRSYLYNCLLSFQIFWKKSLCRS